MSGRAIGTVVGAVIGFYVGGPQGAYYGAMIGGMAGGLIDPETLQGAQFSGRSVAGSESGLARAIIYGTTTVEGRLMDGEAEPRLGTRTESAGKGGPEIESDTALLSYAIEICESSELRGTLVAGVLAVWEDEKLVYDVREGSLVSPADNAKWLQNKTFYYGEETQTPSALLQSIHGAGNVPAYRGTCRMDVEDEDLVLHGERIPRYRFLVSRCAVEPANHVLVTGGAKAGSNFVFSSALAQETPEFIGLETSTGADISFATDAFYNGKWVAISATEVRYSTDNRQTWQSGTVSSSHAFGPLIGLGAGWLAVIPNQSVDSIFVAPPALPLAFEPVIVASTLTNGSPGDAHRAPIGFSANNQYFLCRGTLYRALYRSDAPEGPYVALWDIYKEIEAGRDPNGAHIIFWHDLVAFDGEWYATISWHFDLADRRYQVIKSSDLEDWTTFDVVVDVAYGDPHIPVQLCRGFNETEEWLVCYNTDGTLWTSANGWSAPLSTGLVQSSSGSAGTLLTGGRRVAFTDELFYAIGSTDKAITFDPQTLAVSDLITLPNEQTVSIAASAAFVPSGGGILVPDAPGYEIDPITGEIVGPESDVGNACGMYLDEVVRSLYRLGSQQLTDAMLDLSALSTYYVRGYSVADVGATSADGIEPLRRTYFFDLPEYDGKIHARLRGGDIDWVIDPDDVIPGEESTLQGKRGQETSYPKKLQLSYLALSTDYKPTTQTAEDINPDTFTKSEESYQTNLVLEDDESAKVADVMLKVMRTEREDEQKFSLPIQYVGIIPSDLLSIEGRRYRVDQMRVERNRIVIERAVYDRASAYYSEAVGVEGIQRPPPVSSVRGPTASAVMNAPVLRDQDDRAGIYWAAAGYLPGFRGALLQMSRDGTTFENGPEITNVSTMGLLTADLPSASAYGQDNTNTLRVKMYPGGKDLDSTTYDGLIAEDNVAAILYPDGTTEIIQFQTAVETADREYELTGLMRGRQDTTPGLHLAGAQFVMLDDDVRFVAIRPDDVGKTLTFRAVSLGTNPDDNATQTITFTTIESLREWQPYNVVVTADGLGGYCVEWIGRGRLGSSAVPTQSQWFEGYRVTFTFDSDTYSVDTTEQSVCVDAATMLAEFGTGYGAPVVTVRARSRVATNDDDFDSPPAGPGNPLDGSELFAATGTWPGGYVGVPYVLRNGDADIVITGGYWDASVYGAIAPGVGALGYVPLSGSFSIIGIPNTAGTFTASVEVEATSPVAGHYGSAIVSNSVTIAPTPTYSTIDLRLRENSRDRLIATTPPWTTFELPSGSLYCYGFDTGDHWGEFTITGSTGPLVVGINVALGELSAVGQRPGIAVGFPNHAAVETTLGDGTYAMSYDCATGAWEIFKLGTGSLASGTMALPSGNLARFVCTTNRVSPVQVKGNFGNEAWVYAPTGGQTGVPMPTPVTPAAWDDRDTPYRIMRGGNSFAGASAMLRPRGPGHTLASPGKSSGKWRVGIFANGRTGLAVSTYDSADGGLGAPGTANSIGYDGTTLRWCFGGVASSAAVVVPAETYPYVVFALDMANSEATLCYADFDGNVTPLYTITGVPAGTWFPAESNSTSGATLTYNPAGPSGFGDWL